MSYLSEIVLKEFFAIVPTRGQAGIHGPSRSVQDQKSRTNLDQDRIYYRTRTKEIFETWDRTGPEPRKNSNLGPDQDQNFENLGLIGTGRRRSVARNPLSYY